MADYSIDAFKMHMLISNKLLSMVKQKNRQVCLELINQLKKIKRDYPATRDKMDESISQMERTYETIEWAETTRYTKHTHYEIVDYVIRDSYGTLFKHMLEVKPELEHQIKGAFR